MRPIRSGETPQQEARGPGRLDAPGAFPVVQGGRADARAAPAPCSPCRRSAWRASRGRCGAPNSAGAPRSGGGARVRTAWPRGAPLPRVPAFLPRRGAHRCGARGCGCGAGLRVGGAEPAGQCAVTHVRRPAPGRPGAPPRRSGQSRCSVPPPQEVGPARYARRRSPLEAAPR